MIYECDKCATALPPGVTACPKCGDSFDEAVPVDAELPARGFTARPTPAAPDTTREATAHPTYTWLDAPAEPPAAVAQQRKSTTGAVIAALCVVVVAALFIMGLYDAGKGSAQAPANLGSHDVTSAPAPPDASGGAGVNNDTPDAASGGAQLRVGSENFTKESDYDIVSGEVTNISGRPLASVEAVTTFYDGSGSVVKTEDALINFNPILPEQTSPYKTMGTDNPLIVREKTAFQFLGGEQIVTTFALAPDERRSGNSGEDEAASSSGRDPTSETAAPDTGLSDDPLPRRRLQDTILRDGDLQRKSLAALSISYNTIYAAHGYIFKRESLRRVFAGKDWYRPNSDFAESDLTKTERANLKTIRAYEHSQFGY